MTQAPVQQLLLRFACKHIHFILGALAIFTFSTLATLGTLAGVVMTLGCFLALGEKKQALHDMLAKTAVYPKTALQPRPSAVA